MFHPMKIAASPDVTAMTGTPAIRYRPTTEFSNSSRLRHGKIMPAISVPKNDTAGTSTASSTNVLNSLV